MKIVLGNGERVQCEQFVYLGGVIVEDKDVVRRIGLAVGTVRNLHKIWKSTKVLLYQTLVQTIILYNSKTWELKEGQKRHIYVSLETDLRCNEERLQTKCGHIERAGDPKGHCSSPADTQIDVFRSCDLHRK